MYPFDLNNFPYKEFTILTVSKDDIIPCGYDDTFYTLCKGTYILYVTQLSPFWKIYYPYLSAVIPIKSEKDKWNN